MSGNTIVRLFSMTKCLVVPRFDGPIMRGDSGTVWARWTRFVIMIDGGCIKGGSDVSECFYTQLGIFWLSLTSQKVFLIVFLISILDPTKSLNTSIIPGLFALRKTEPLMTSLASIFKYNYLPNYTSPLKKKTQQTVPVFFCWSFLYLSTPWCVVSQGCCLCHFLPRDRPKHRFGWSCQQVTMLFTADHRGGVFRDVMAWMVSGCFRVKDGNTDSCILYMYVHHSKISL